MFNICSLIRLYKVVICISVLKRTVLKITFNREVITITGGDDFLRVLKYSQKLYLKLSEDIRSKYSITQIEFDVIAFLNNHPQFNTAKDICDMRMLAKSGVSVAVDRLTNMGFLDCAADKEDRRVVRLNFRPEADGVRNEIKLVQISFGCAVFNGIPQDESDNFFKTLSAINRNIENAMEEAQK